MSDRVEDWEDDGHVCQECVNKDAEIERLNKQHDDFLQEFWATNAENAKLQAVVDAAKEFKEWWHEDMRGSVSYDKLCAALAAEEDECDCGMRGCLECWPEDK